MRYIFTIFLILLSTNIFSQNKEVEELHESLSSFKSEEEHYGVKKEKAYRLLTIDRYNDVAIFYLLISFQKANQNDSISSLFDKLIENNKNEVEPYLIREKYESYEGLSYTDRINNLKEAYKIDPNEERVNYLLGKLYYALFIREYNNNRKKVNLDYYATNSIQYFSVLYEQKESHKETLKFPLLQLANYLGDANKKKVYENNNVQTSYFPVSAFVYFPIDWKTNYSVNVVDYVSGSDFNYSGIESAIFTINWYSKHLKALEEPVLRDSFPTKIFRFTYLRTFDNPIVIGLENNNDTIIIYWKVTNGAGGYDPGNIIEKKTKVLTIDDWNKIENKIKSLKFWSLPPFEKELLGEDGSQWILEGKTLGKYHVVDRWCGGEISSICNDLIELTDLKIKNIY